jgi:hypothetical protein
MVFSTVVAFYVSVKRHVTTPNAVLLRKERPKEEREKIKMDEGEPRRRPEFP